MSALAPSVCMSMSDGCRQLIFCVPYPKNLEYRWFICCSARVVIRFLEIILLSLLQVATRSKAEPFASYQDIFAKRSCCYWCLTFYLINPINIPYVVQGIRAFARSMKRSKVNSPIVSYADIQELMSDILDATIERIEVSHVGHKSKPGSVIHIYWNLG